MTPLFKNFIGMNWLLVLNMAALIVFGVYAIFNASALTRRRPSSR
jgi:rod shape determining protein RodA